jgi:hypothetical protein
VKLDKCGKIKQKFEDFLDHAIIQTLMLTVTLYVLLGDDIRLSGTPKSSDDIFTVLTSISLVLFSIELVIASIGYKTYPFSLFFWLDIVSTASLVTDIEPLMDYFLSIVEDFEADITTGTSGSDLGQITRASRGARIGTKAGRMTKIVRLIRLIRLVKLYKSVNK